MNNASTRALTHTVCAREIESPHSSAGGGFHYKSSEIDTTFSSSIFTSNFDICAEWDLGTVRLWLLMIATYKKDGKVVFATNKLEKNTTSS